MEQHDPRLQGGLPLKQGYLLLTLFILLFSLTPPLWAQTAQSVQQDPGGELDFLDQEYRKEALRELALDELARGEYEEALNHLNAAIALAPEDRELQDLKQSVEDLLILDQEHPMSDEANPENPDFSEFRKPEEEEIISPDFAMELLSESQRVDPSVKRNAYSLEIGNAYGLTQPLYLSDTRVLSEPDDLPSNPFYRLSAEGQAFFFEKKRNIGLGVRYKDALYNANSVDMLDRMFDISLHYRGFFAETMESRLILGAKIGTGFIGMKKFPDPDEDEDDDTDDLDESELSNQSMFIAGVYFSDALFRYLFKNSTFFKRLVMEMNFDFIFLTSLDNVSLSQYSISAGYHFNDHFSASLFSEAFNTSTDIQNTSSWEIGGRLKLSY